MVNSVSIIILLRQLLLLLLPMMISSFVSRSRSSSNNNSIIYRRPLSILSSSFIGTTNRNNNIGRNVVQQLLLQQQPPQERYSFRRPPTIFFSTSSSSSSNEIDTTGSVTDSITPTNKKFVLPEYHNPKPKRRRNEPIILNLPTVLLKRTKQSKAFRDGNQLVFTRAIQSVIPKSIEKQQGELVIVAVNEDDSGRSNNNKDNDTSNNNKSQQPQQQQQQQQPSQQIIGIGTYNNESLYKVRILVHQYIQNELYEDIIRTCTTPTEAIEVILQYHIRGAIQLRSAMGLSHITTIDTVTDTYRLINGEGDSLSGLAVDIIGGSVAVVMSSASWCEIYKDTIIKVLSAELSGLEIIWKTTESRLKQDGYLALDSTTNQSGDDEDDDDDDDTIDPSDSSDDSKMILSKENGIYFETYPYSDGQKTGVYCDQRENRFHIASLCSNKNVLDLCCYHGGFSITAMVQGNAASVTGVDSSSIAIEIAKANARRNNCPDDQTHFITADIASFLQDEYRQQKYYDVVVLDPPKLAPSNKLLDKARRKYHALNRDAMKVINPTTGGLLLSCTCSAAMTVEDGGQYFLNMIHGAALGANRQITLLQTRGAASCHTISPICHPAGAYLTAALFYVHPIITINNNES